MSPPTPRHYRRWTPEDDLVLVDGWLEDNAWTISAKLGRTVYAVKARAQVLGLGSGRGRYYSLSAVARRLGVSWLLVHRLAAAAGVTMQRLPGTGWRPRPRTAKGRHWAFDSVAVEALEAELKRQLNADAGVTAA